MNHHQILMCAPSFERALTIDVSTQKPVKELFGRLGEAIRAHDAGTLRHRVYRTCPTCRGQINRKCEICGGAGHTHVDMEAQ